MTALFIATGLAVVLLTLRLAWPSLQRWAIQSDSVPAPLREFAAASLSHGGVLKMAAYCSLLPLVDRRLPRPMVAWLCRNVGKQQGIDFRESELPVESYATLNEFFARGLKPDCRPLARGPDAVIAPADATVVATDELRPDSPIRAKGMPYQLEDLLPPDEAARFIGGRSVVFYLRPGDCHRVFCPVDDAQVRSAVAIPGGTLPVSDDVHALVPGIYARNRRLVHLLQTAHGSVALAMIGAYNVGRIDSTYAPAAVVDGHTRSLQRHTFTPAPRLSRGEWMATFHLGSAIVLLFEAGRFLPEGLEPGRRLRYGQAIGMWHAAPAASPSAPRQRHDASPRRE